MKKFKVVHDKRIKQGDLFLSDQVKLRKVLDTEEDLDEAINNYKSMIKSNPSKEFPYNRLMIIYRTRKDYKKELEIIARGIKVFEKLYAPSLKISRNKQIASISNALLKSTGLIDKKGQAVFQKEPIAKWTKRKELLEKKLSRKK